MSDICPVLGATSRALHLQPVIVMFVLAEVRRRQVGRRNQYRANSPQDPRADGPGAGRGGDVERYSGGEAMMLSPSTVASPKLVSSFASSPCPGVPRPDRPA